MVTKLKSGLVLVLSASAAMAGQSAQAQLPPVEGCTGAPWAMKAIPSQMFGSLAGPSSINEGDAFAFVASGTDQDVVPCYKANMQVERWDPAYPNEHAPVVLTNTAQSNPVLNLTGNNATGTGTWEVFGVAVPVDQDRIKACTVKFVDNNPIFSAVDADTAEYTKMILVKDVPSP